VAKRPRSRKTTRRPARATRARKRAGRRTAARAEGPRRNLPLRQLRLELDLAVAKLSRRVEETGQPSAKVSSAINVFTRWATEIDAMCNDASGSFCGPTMDPLA
jgi:hypothetical protein